MGKTKISYCDYTVNFTKWFCTKVSEGCKHCYMMRLAEKSPQHAADHPVWRQAAIHEIATLPTGSVCFANDMLDWWHEQMPKHYIEWILQAFASRPDVTFLTLTKRIERLAERYGDHRWSENIWIGTSVENERNAWRIAVLQEIPAAHLWISVEPLIGSVGALDLERIGQVVCGGESGEFHRGLDLNWAREVRDQCAASGVPFFYKQGSHQFSEQMRVLDGYVSTDADLAWRKPVETAKQEGLF